MANIGSISERKEYDPLSALLGSTGLKGKGKPTEDNELFKKHY